MFFFITFDLIFEFLSGKNILGNQSSYEGRLSGVMGDELIIGNIYTGFSFIVILFLATKFSNNKINFLIFIIFFITNFLIGERANFIKFALMSIILIFIINKNSIKKLILFFSILLILILTLINHSSVLQNKYVNEFIKPIINTNNIESLLKNTHHGSHLITAFNIFKDNYYFGSGIKTFRSECKNLKYEIHDSPFSDWRCSTHPHQHHFEFLSETGIFGYLFYIWFFLMSFFYFFKNYKKFEFFQIAGALYVFVNILPLIPSGSFFSTISSVVFWFNYALMFSKRP